MLDIKTFMEQIVPDGVDRMKGGGGGEDIIDDINQCSFAIRTSLLHPKDDIEGGHTFNVHGVGLG